MCSDKACSDLTFLFNYFPFHNCHTPYFKRKATSHTSRLLLWGTDSRCKKKKQKYNIHRSLKPEPQKTPNKTKQKIKNSQKTIRTEKGRELWLKILCPCRCKNKNKK